MPLTQSRGVRATMMLCDFAAVAEGKFYISGGGWTIAGPQPTNLAIALILHIPWDLTNQEIAFRISLHNEDGAPVTNLGPLGEQSIEAQGSLEVGRPPGLKKGSVLGAPIPINLGPMQFAAGRYYWELEINGETEDDWRIVFEWRAPTLTGGSDPTNIPNF